MSTTITHTDKKKSLAPKLRFKGFDEGWKKQTLFDISENVSYGMNAAATEYDGIHKYIRITDIDVNTGEFKPDPLTSPLGAIDEKFKLKQGDIVFARTGASVGKSHLYNPKDGALYFAGFLIKFSITKANPFFIYSLTLKEAYNKWVHIYSMRSGQPGLNAEEYKALKLNIPTLPEQQKIASFLSAVDEKLQQLTRKKQLLEQYKKGVMQQLFSGKLRFKDENGKAFPKWEEKKLGDVGNTFNGLTGKTKENFGEGKPYIQYMQIFANPKIDITKCGLVQIDADENQPRVQYGDIFFTTSSETTHEIGFTSVLQEKVEEMYLNSFCFGFRPNSLEQLNPAFASYLFRNEIFRKIIIKLAQGSTRYNMSKVQLMKLKVLLPCIEEQKKIAIFLSNIDNKIESVTKQITQTQTFKKGLLQQLFV